MEPVGADEMVIENPVGPADPSAFVAVTAMIDVPGVVGDPDSNPDAERARPAGTPDALHVIGVEPVAVNCTEYPAPTIPAVSGEVVMNAGGMIAAAIVSANARLLVPAAFDA